MTKLRKSSKRGFFIKLFILAMVFVVIATSSQFANYYFDLEMKETHEYHLTFKTDGEQTHYYVERYNKSMDGKIDLTYTTSSNTLEVDTKNIKVLHIDCVSMYNDESQKVFGIDPYDYPNYYKQYFIEKDLFKVKVDTQTAYTNLTFKYTPIPIKVIVNGQEWWKAGINYSYNGEDIVFTSVPQGYSEIYIYFQEDPGLKPPHAAFTIKFLDLNTIRFDATLSNDPNGYIENYLWDFGDNEHPFGSGCVVDHEYSGFANYTVILTIRDNDLLKDSAYRIITVGWNASPRELKEGVLEKLESAKIGNNAFDKIIDDIIENIEESLDNNQWLDELHLDTKFGHKVFNQEKLGIKALMRLLAGNDTSQALNASCHSAIEALIEADDMLANIAFMEALGYFGDPKVDKELAKCREEFGGADREIASENYDKAIDHYKKAWEHALAAIKHGSKE